jgi:hypothetical protein
MAELANAFVIHSGQYLGVERIIFVSIFKNNDVESHKACCHKQYVCGVGPSKNVISNVLFQLTMFNKERHTTKLITLIKKSFVPGASFTKLTCGFDITYGNFLL